MEEYGLEGWETLDGPPDETPFWEMGESCFSGGGLSPLPLGDCEGAFFSGRRAERLKDGTQRVAGDAGIATGARAVADGGSLSSNAKLESEGPGSGNTPTTCGSIRGGNATLRFP